MFLCGFAERDIPFFGLASSYSGNWRKCMGVGDFGGKDRVLLDLVNSGVGVLLLGKRVWSPYLCSVLSCL